MWQNLVLKFIPIILKQSTPAIKAGLKTVLTDLRVKAKATPNPFDDMLVDVLEGLFDEE